MKNLLVVAAALCVGSFASAGTFAELPSVNFGGYNVTADNVCVQGENLKTIKPVKVCYETAVVARYACSQGEVQRCHLLRNGDMPHVGEILKEEAACVKAGAETLTTSRAYKKAVCNKWNTPNEADFLRCEGSTYVNELYPLNVRYNIVSTDGGVGYRVVGQGTLAIPACAN